MSLEFGDVHVMNYKVSNSLEQAGSTSCPFCSFKALFLSELYFQNLPYSIKILFDD